MNTDPQLLFEESTHTYTLHRAGFADLILPSVTQIMEPLERKVYGDISSFTLGNAADRGTRFHRAAEQYLKYGFRNVDEDCAGYFDGFMRFLADHPDWKPVHSEYRFYHKAFLYAGTADLLTIVDRRGQTDGTFSAESIDRPVDLTNASVRLYCHKPDGTVTFSDGTITDAANGVASFILPYQATTVAGYVTCEIMITWPDNSTLKAVGLNLNVQESNLDDAVESSSEYSALAVALGKADTAATTAAQAAADAQEAVSDAQAAVLSSNAATAAANTATVAASTAASAANQAAQNTGQLYRMIDPLTGHIAYVTDVINDLTTYIFRDAVTAQSVDDLNKAAQDFDALNVSARDFDVSAKTILGVA